MIKRSATTPRFLAALLLLLVACSDSDGPTDPVDTNQPDGVLLEGESTDAAREALLRLPPTPAASDEILPNGLLSTRIEAILHPEATLGAANAALDDAGARIISMRPGSLFLTLIVDAVADAAAAQSVADDLARSGAFLHAAPAWNIDIRLPLPDSFRDERGLPASGVHGLSHLIDLRLPAAWNTSPGNFATLPTVAVLIPDEYYSDQPPAQLGDLTFVPGGSFKTTATANSYVGNHGFHVAGIVGAAYDATAPTGTSPDPGELLDLRALPVGGLTWTELLQEISGAFPSDLFFVVNTSLAYNDPEFVKSSRLTRAYHAMAWRSYGAPEQGRFLLAAAAGNEGQTAGEGGSARFSSPFTAARLWGDLRDMTENQALSPAEQVALDVMWAELIQLVPEAAIAMDNTLVVGNMNELEQPASNTSRDWEVLAPGITIAGPCVIQDPAYDGSNSYCDGSIAYYSGSSMAAPQVAGIAAWLYSLSPDLLPHQIVERLLNSAIFSIAPGLVDAYQATLALDGSIAAADRRLALLDVALGDSQSGGADGLFDENDVEALLAFFTVYEDLREQAEFPSPDYSRYDLSGDGWTGGEFTGRVDLSVDETPAFGIVFQNAQGNQLSFDENSVNDLDVLCYYAYSPLFTGDESARDDLLADCLGAPGGRLVILAVEEEEDASSAIARAESYVVDDPAGTCIVLSELFAPMDEVDQFTTIQTASCASSGSLGSASSVCEVDYDQAATWDGPHEKVTQLFLQASANGSSSNSGVSSASAAAGFDLSVYFNVENGPVAVNFQGSTTVVGSGRAWIEIWDLDDPIGHAQFVIFDNGSFGPFLLNVDETISLPMSRYYMQGFFRVSATENGDASIGTYEIMMTVDP